MNDPAHPLDRATELARLEPVDQAAWQATATGVMRRVRAGVRPGRRIRVALPDDRGSSTHVSERVLVTSVGEALAGIAGLAPSDVRVELDGDRCTAVAVALVARYGSDLQVLGEQCRAAVAAVLVDVLAVDGASVDVDVSVVDVTLEDPRH